GRPPVPVAALDWREWLEARGWWRALVDNDEKVRFMAVAPTSGSVPLPFVGRQDQLKEMWKFLAENYELQGGNHSARAFVERTPIMYFQASPGIGKTRLLSELCRSDPMDFIPWASMPRPHFLPISFNGRTALDNVDMERDIVSLLNGTYASLAVLRIVYTEACNTDRVLWKDFAVEAGNAIASGALTRINHFSTIALRDFLSARGVGADVPTVLLVDEITKLNVANVGADAADKMRQELSGMSDDLLASVIFSTLEERVITRERRTPSNRCVQPLTLPLLPFQVGGPLLEAASRTALKELGLEEQIDAKLLQHGCAVLAAAALGHARTIEYMASAFKVEIAVQRPEWQAGDVFDSEPIILKAISRIIGAYGPDSLAPAEV
ncbi:unnamed protein product, partial [Phaeothamnion confervicola]